MDTLDWDDLRLLLQVARRGSFLRASSDIGVAPSTLSRRITAFEAKLGTLLLERGVDGCRLTARGKALADIAETLARQLHQEQTNAASSEGLSGTITITTGDGFVPRLSKACSTFLEDHPACSIEFLVDAGFARLSRGDADIAIRTVELEEPSLIYRKLGALQFALYATADVAERLTGTTDLARVAAVTMLPPLDAMAHNRVAREAGLVNERVRVSSFAALVEAVHAGLGVGVLPHTRASGLVRVFPEIRLPDKAVFLVTRPSAAKQPHVRACIEAISESFRDVLR